MNTIRTISLFLILPLVVGGCVTVNQAEAPLKITEFGKTTAFKECYLLTFTRRSPESGGHWWMSGKERRPPGVTVSATVRMVDSGEVVYQPGYLMYLIGPYARSKAETYDYWVFKEGYLPENLEDRDIQYAMRNNKPAPASMEKFVPREDYSARHALDGGWLLVNNAGFLAMDDELTRKVVTLVLGQVKEVRDRAVKPRRAEDARKIIGTLEKMLTGSGT